MIMSMNFICATAPGLIPRSEQRKEECQDKALVKKIGLDENEYFGIFALADGASSAKYATQGANLAITYFVEEVEKLIEDYKKYSEYQKNCQTDFFQSEIIIAEPDILEKIILSVRHRLEQYVNDNHSLLSDYHTTLVVCIYHKSEQNKLVVGSIGDSIIAVFNEVEKEIFLPNNNEVKERLANKKNWQFEEYAATLKVQCNFIGVWNMCWLCSKKE